MIIKFKKNIPSIARSLMIETIRRALVRKAETIMVINKKSYYRLDILGKFTKKQESEIKIYCS